MVLLISSRKPEEEEVVIAPLFLSLNVSLGFYLYRKMGTWTKELEKPYYERIGLNYGFPKLNGLKIGINVKAHRFKADLTELLVSYPIVFFTNKGQ